MKQKVHSVSYLAKAEFEFKNGVYDLVALPAGAEVVKINLEVVGDPNEGNIYVGLKDEPTKKDYFLSLECSRFFAGESNVVMASEKVATSKRDYTATSNKVVVAEVERAISKDTLKCILRVVYFLPSVIEVEY